RFFDDRPASFLDVDCADLLIVDFGLTIAGNDLSRSVFEHIDAVIALFNEGDGGSGRIYFEINRLVCVIVICVNDFELAAIKTVDPEGRGADGQCQLDNAAAELSKSEVGVATDANQITAAQLNFCASAGTAIELVAFIKRQIERRVEPIFP